MKFYDRFQLNFNVKFTLMPPLLLCVAEKPSVARTAAEILSGGRARSEQKRSRNTTVTNLFFVGRFLNREVDICFTHVLGHVFSYDFPPEYKNWSDREPEELFRAKIVKYIPDEMKILETNLHELSRRATYLMLWLDNDREGENISEEVECICLSTNKNLEIYRARFSALIKQDLWNALNHPQSINRLDSKAVQLRSEIDLRSGAAFTRFQTLRFRGLVNKMNPGKKGVPISYGACQFPTLGFVVERFLKRKNFVPEKFWYIDCVVPKDEQQVPLKWDRGKIFCKLSCFALYASILDDPLAIVMDKKEKRIPKYKPEPLATVDFQKCISKYEHIDSHRAMKIAEDLYSSGYISYPRTETNSFPKNFNLQEIVEMLTRYNDGDRRLPIAQYASYLKDHIEPPRVGKESDNAHPPIYPLKVLDDNGPNITAEHKKVYKFIAARYLACLSKNAIGAETRIFFDVGGEGFHLKGLTVIDRGFLDIYPYVKWEGNVVPNFQPGERIKPTEIKMREGLTTAPLLLTEADLIKRMSETGIGTDATIAEHIKKILDREYARKINNFFEPLPLGLALVMGYDAMGIELAKPKLRAQTEKTMQEVANGDINYEQALKRFVDEYDTAFFQVKQMAHVLDRSFQDQFMDQMQNQIPNQNQNQNAPPAARGGRGRGRGRGQGRGRRGGAT